MQQYHSINLQIHTISFKYCFFLWSANVKKRFILLWTLYTLLPRATIHHKNTHYLKAQRTTFSPLQNVMTSFEIKPTLYNLRSKTTLSKAKLNSQPIAHKYATGSDKIAFCGAELRVLIFFFLTITCYLLAFVTLFQIWWVGTFTWSDFGQKLVQKYSARCKKKTTIFCGSAQQATKSHTLLVNFVFFKYYIYVICFDANNNLTTCSEECINFVYMKYYCTVT